MNGGTARETGLVDTWRLQPSAQAPETQLHWAVLFKARQKCYACNRFVADLVEGSGEGTLLCRKESVLRRGSVQARPYPCSGSRGCLWRRRPADRRRICCGRLWQRRPPDRSRICCGRIVRRFGSPLSMRRKSPTSAWRPSRSSTTTSRTPGQAYSSLLCEEAAAADTAAEAAEAAAAFEPAEEAAEVAAAPAAAVASEAAAAAAGVGEDAADAAAAP